MGAEPGACEAAPSVRLDRSVAARPPEAPAWNEDADLLRSGGPEVVGAAGCPGRRSGQADRGPEEPCSLPGAALRGELMMGTVMTCARNHETIGGARSARHTGKESPSCEHSS